MGGSAPKNPPPLPPPPERSEAAFAAGLERGRIRQRRGRQATVIAGLMPSQTQTRSTVLGGTAPTGR